MEAPTARSVDSSTAWGCADFGSLVWETWDEEHFVFNPRSGETHVLNALAADMLCLLGRRPHTPGDLASRFRERLSEVQDPEQAVQALLFQLDQLGLIDRCRP